MPKRHSRKRERDRALHELWDGKDEAVFERLGVPRERVKAAQSDLQGRIVLPGDPGYDADRMLSNPVFDPTPSMIVLCETEADVYVALYLALSSPLPFTVRSGGHCTAGFSGGSGVMIDVAGLDGIAIGAGGQEAVVGAGCPFGQLDQVLGSYGLHVPAGECDDVCVGGFVQGGGLGFTSTTFGMNCDNVLALRVMLADGAVVVASPMQNADLFWAMRGGTGGNFGVLLSVTYQLRPLGDVMGFALAWAVDTPAGLGQAVDALMLLQSTYMDASPFGPGLNLQALLVWQTILDPAQPPLPQPIPVFMVRGLWVGDPAGGAQAMAPLAALPGAVTQWTMVGAYKAVLDALLGRPQDQPLVDPSLGPPNEDKASRYVGRDLQPSEWQSILSYVTDQSPNTLSYMYLELYGGAIAAYPPDGNAFVHRDAHFNAVLDVFWYRPGERAGVEAFLGGWDRLLETVWNGEVYQNYASVNVPDYRRNYWGAAFPGLACVKAKYDPGHRFVFAQEAAMPPGAALPPASSLPAFLAAALAQPIDYAGGRPPPAG